MTNNTIASDKNLNYGEALRAKMKKQQESQGVFDFIFTYIYPMFPFFEFMQYKFKKISIGITFFIAFLPFFLGAILALVNMGGMGGRGSIIGWIFMIISYYVVSANQTLFYSILVINLIIVYSFGYYQIVTKKK